MRFSPLDSSDDFMGEMVSVFLYLLKFPSYDVINDVIMSDADCTPGREPRSVAASICGLLSYFRSRLKLTSRMNTIDYTPVTSAESLLGDEKMLPSNGSRPMVMSCDEYVNYVDELLAQQVPIVIQTFNASILHTYILYTYMAVATRREPDICLHSLHVGKSYPQPNSNANPNPNLTLLTRLTLLTLLYPTNPNRNSSKTAKLNSFRRRSQQNHPDDDVLRTNCIRDNYWPSVCARPN